MSKEDRFEPWIKALLQADDVMKRTLLAEAIMIVLELILQNHIYQFNNVIRKQKEGGPIGLDLTGVIAKIFMGWWDEQLLLKLQENRMVIKMYKRYVDDINMCVSCAIPGSRVIGHEIQVVEDRINEDECIDKDKRTLDIIQKLGETIHESIKLEYDIPSAHTDGKLPMLDLKIWIEKNSDNEHKIIYEHYTKDVSSLLLTNARSAMAWKQKRTILTQQCLKIMLNCSPDLPWQQTAQHIEHFCHRMQSSGYDRRMKYEVVKSAINAYRLMKKDDEEGLKPMYRGRRHERTSRRKDKMSKRNNWFTDARNESVLFVPATPNSELAKLYRQEIRESKIRIKVVEKSGTKIKDTLQKNSVTSNDGCDDSTCFVCNTEGGGRCRASAVTYCIDCRSEICEYVYNGQTGKNGNARGGEHKEDYRKNSRNSVITRNRNWG